MTGTASARVLVDAVEGFPALLAARDRLSQCAGGDGAMATLVPIVESDVALAIAVLDLANDGPRRGTVASVTEAVRWAGPMRLRALAERVSCIDPLSDDLPDAVLLHFRLHCLTAQATMDRLALATGHEDRDELLTAALLHDIGKLVLCEQQHDRSVAEPGAHAAAPEVRLQGERDRYGTDHAELGAELAKQIGLPNRLVRAIAEHHTAGNGAAGMVRLADMLTLYAQGRVVNLTVLVELSLNVGLAREQLGRLMYELPSAASSTRSTLRPCPLSERELQVLRQLAAGQVYKQIGASLGLSPSTVRSHLHRIYTRIDVADRTQAVLLARDCGWI